MRSIKRPDIPKLEPYPQRNYMMNNTVFKQQIKRILELSNSAKTFYSDKLPTWLSLTLAISKQERF